MLKEMERKINAAVNAMSSVWEAEFCGETTLSQFDATARELATLLPVQEFILDRQVVVIVHDGVFHADDVLCVAMLQRQYGIHNVRIIRTRDKKTFDTADFILDDSQTIPELIANGKVYFDHHDPETTKAKHENGVYKCAADKLASFLGYPKSFWDRAMYGVSAQDNGQKMDFPNPFNFIHTLNLEWNKDIYGPEQDRQFELAVDMAGTILDNIMASIKLEQEAKAECEAAIAASTNAIVKLPRYIGGWQKYICQYNEAHPCARKLLVLFPSGKNWNVQVVPVLENSFDSYLHLFYPGKRGKELDKATGLIHSVFCHAGAFLSGWQTEGMAYNFATMCLLGEYDFWKWYNHKALNDYEAFLDLMDQDLPF